MGWLILALVILLIWIVGNVAARADWGGMHVNWLDGWTRILCRYLHGVTSPSLNLPKQGAAIIAANHASGLDPLLLISASRRPVRFLIAAEEYHRPVLNWLFRAAGCIPVDRKGRPEKALRVALRALEKGEVVALFPHGGIHLDTDPPKRIKAGIVRLAAWSATPVYPVRIDGVRGQGKVITAPFIPGKVRLSASPPIIVTEASYQKSLDAITQAIETPARPS